MFLRGVNGSGNDIYADPGLNIRGRVKGRLNDVGSFEQDAFQGNHHSYAWSNPPGYGGPNNTDGVDQRNGHYVTTLTITDPVTDGRNGNPRVSMETRPKNVYVYYLIKAGIPA